MPKAIQGSVGTGGMNNSQHVLTVQYLLNCVPAGEGGPSPELVVDGIVGPKTIAAIQKFQKARFNWADGRVDPTGNTIKALQPYDPCPFIPLVTKGQKSGGLGQKDLGQKQMSGDKQGGYGDKLGGQLGEKFGGVYGDKAGGMPGSKGMPGFKSW